MVTSRGPAPKVLEYREDPEAIKLSQDQSAKTRKRGYGDAAYWEHRYQNGGGSAFDWYQNYAGLKTVLRKYVTVTADVLMLGCGNSALSEDMAKDGYLSITNVDISPTVIKTMKMRHLDIPHLKHVCADARDMSMFKSCSFDAVIDKGTLDALMCGDDAIENVRRMVSEVFRLLRPGGIYFMVSYGEPKTRFQHMGPSQQPWTVNVHLLAKPSTSKKCEYNPWVNTLDPVPVEENGTFPLHLQLRDGDYHYVYACIKEKPVACSR